MHKVSTIQLVLTGEIKEQLSVTSNSSATIAQLPVQPEDFHSVLKNSSCSNSRYLEKSRRTA